VPSAIPATRHPCRGGQVQYPLLSGSAERHPAERHPPQETSAVSPSLRIGPQPTCGDAGCGAAECRQRPVLHRPAHASSELAFRAPVPSRRHTAKDGCARIGDAMRQSACFGARPHGRHRGVTGVTEPSRHRGRPRSEQHVCTCTCAQHVHVMSTSMYMDMSTSMYMDMSMSMSMWRAATAAAPSKLRRTSRMCLLRLGALEQLDVPD